MHHFRHTVVCLLLALMMVATGVPTLAADATSFNPVPVSVVAKSSGGVPVGSIISWPVATNPSDWDKWLECNGQAISAAAYPELFALVGGNVPDYRGLFLRGVGGNSAALGVTQGDAIRNITGQAGYIQFGQNWGFANGAFYVSGNQGRARINGSEYEPLLNFDASRVVPTAPENRPENKAIRYLIRAYP